MHKQIDVVTIGTGSAAGTIASRCKAAGMTVAITDSRQYGGTCALRGCNPKKVLVGASEAVDWSRRMKEKGVDSDDIRINWNALMRFKRTFTEPVPQQIEHSYRRSGIEIFRGIARFTGTNTVQIGGDLLDAKYIAIATGMRPATLSFPGADLAVTSDQFLELEYLPSRIVFIGGGYVSMEFAHVAARAGAQVTVLHRQARPLQDFDPDMVELLVKKTRAIGIDLRLLTGVTAIEKRNNGLVVSARQESTELRIDADMVVHGAGRVPNLDDLGLTQGRVAFDPRLGVTVNDYLQSVSNAAVYAAGDAAASGAKPLSPVASYEGHIVADNIIRGNQRKHERPVTPTVTFTTPPIASVGMLEQVAKEKGVTFSTRFEDTSGWYSSKRLAETHSAAKILIEEGTDRILGAHLLDPHADELINIFALAMQYGITAPQLKRMIFAYPTHASNIQYLL